MIFFEQRATIKEVKMGQIGLRLLLTIVALPPTFCYAQSDAERLLSKVRNRVVALRVWGDKAPTAQFPQGEPPIWGTGFVVGPPGSKADEKERIITAGHVVQKNDMWAKKGGGPARTVYPWILGQAGRTQIEGFRGVLVHATSDIAQVYGPRNLEPVVIKTDALNNNERYFVVSWSFDDVWGEPTEEPYVKEIKVVTPTSSDPPIEPGLALVEVVKGQQNAYFKESESGSPVFNVSGQAVGIMIRERVDETSGLAARGIALPFAEVAAWLDEVRQMPVREPAPVILADVLPMGAQEGSFTANIGGCVFLGKYSALNQNPVSDQVSKDAPVGIPYLKRFINLFPEAIPDRVSDQDAVLTKRLPESELVSIPQGGGLNIRAHCPNVVPKPKRANDWERNAYYGPIIAVADDQFRIRIKLVQRQAYLEDFFYWGEIESVSVRAR